MLRYLPNLDLVMVFLNFDIAGDVGALGWWDLFINYGYHFHLKASFNFILMSLEFHVFKSWLIVCFYRIAECFAFLVCTKWSNPVIHRNSPTREESSSSSALRYLDWNSGLVVSSEDHSQDRMCGLQDIGGHIMKIPIIGFQILLCMKLEVSIIALVDTVTKFLNNLQVLGCFNY